MGKDRPNQTQRPEAVAKAPSQRKPYRKPDFVCEAVFETMALACGKIQPTVQQCKFNHRNS